MDVERGDLWWADLGEPRGSAPGLRRPIVITQSDAYNRSRLSTVIGVAVTSNERLASMPGNVFLPTADTGLPEDSVANVTQVVTIDRSALETRIGALPPWLLAEVDRGLRRVLAL